MLIWIHTLLHLCMNHLLLVMETFRSPCFLFFWNGENSWPKFSSQESHITSPIFQSQVRKLRAFTDLEILNDHTFNGTTFVYASEVFRERTYAYLMCQWKELMHIWSVHERNLCIPEVFLEEIYIHIPRVHRRNLCILTCSQKEFVYI